MWAGNYYDFGIQAPASLYAFPDEPLGAEDFAKGNVVHEYVQNYAKKHGIYEVAKLETNVVSLDRDEGSWTVTTSNNQRFEGFSAVVVATGVYCTHNAFVPDVRDREAFRGEWLHSVRFRDPEVCRGKRVVVVGYGKSAFDCSEVSAGHGATSTTLLHRRTHWPMPGKILGLVPFEYATFNRLGAALLWPPYVKSGPVERALAAIPGFLKLYWKIVSVVFSRQMGLGELEPEAPLATDIWCGHGVFPNPEFFDLIRAGRIEPLKGNLIRVVDGETLEVETPRGDRRRVSADVVVFGTGFRRNLSILPEQLKTKVEEDGLWLYRNIVSPDVPNCFFVGSQATTFTNITTASLQARWVATLLKRKHDLPSQAQMRDAVARVADWKRKTMPLAGPSRSIFLQLHQLHYHDELLKDMGYEIHTKQSSFAEVFDPYRPADYAAVVAGQPPKHGADQPSFLKSFLNTIALLVLVALAAYAFQARFN